MSLFGMVERPPLNTLDQIRLKSEIPNYLDMKKIRKFQFKQV